MVEGRMSFPNGEEFSNTLYHFTDKSLTDLYDFMAPFYDQGFYSLRPPAIKEYHEEDIILQYQNRIEQFKQFSNINGYSDDEIYEKIDETSYINPSNGRFDYDRGAPGAVLIYPEDLRIRMYGAAKVNGTWHGSLMVYAD